MTTLPQKQVKFNSNIIVNHSGGSLTNDGGLILVNEFMDKLNFSDLATQLVPFQDTRHYCSHTNQKMIKQLILQLIAGYKADAVANFLQADPLFPSLLAASVASQPSLSRFFSRISEETIHGFDVLNQTLIDNVRVIRNQTQAILDIDSTHSDTYGRQEATTYNAHYQTTGYHPMILTEAISGDIIRATLRPGNYYTSRNVEAFLRPVFEHYQSTVPTTDVLLRGDSGFAAPELYALCEEYDVQFVIRLKSNKRLGSLSEYTTYDNNGKIPLDQSERYYDNFEYQAGSWDIPRRICIESYRPAGELLFHHIYIVTNLSKNVNAETIFKTYRKRGAMENIIKEAKLGFFFDKTDSPSFIQNAARMMLSVLAYNMINFMRTLCFGPDHQANQINTIRHKLIRIAGKIVRTGRHTYLKLSSAHVYQQEFYNIFERISKLRC